MVDKLSMGFTRHDPRSGSYTWVKAWYKDEYCGWYLLDVMMIAQNRRGVCFWSSNKDGDVSKTIP